MLEIPGSANIAISLTSARLAGDQTKLSQASSGEDGNHKGDPKRQSFGCRIASKRIRVSSSRP